MSLIKCPECNKEMSDTLKSCPHCGFNIKVKKEKVLKEKKFKGIIANVFNWVKNNKKKTGIIVGIFLLVLIVSHLIIYYFSLETKRMAEHGVSLLENKGFECERQNDYDLREMTDYYSGEVYVCKLEKNGHKEEVAIYYSPNVSMYRKAKSPELYVSLVYLYKAKGYNFYISPTHFDSLDIISMETDKDNERICTFNPVEGDDFSKKKAKVNDYCYEGIMTDNKREDCNVCEYYLDEVNEGLKFFDDLYEDILDR